MKQTLSILLGFLPWIAFAIISGPSKLRLDVAIIVAVILVLVLGLRQLARRFILTWGTLLFFGINLFVVVLRGNPWVIKDLDILSRGTLAAIAWLSILMRRPFVAQYARDTVPPERQATPAFFPVCRTLSALWGVIFLIGMLMSMAKARGWLAGGAAYQAVSIGLIGLGLWFNHWYPKYVYGKTRAALGR